MTKEGALYSFWNGFGLTAYEENTVPSDATFPYITYQVVTDSFNNPVNTAVSIWYRSESWLQINAKANEISHAIGRGGCYIHCDDGAIYIRRGEPFAQNMKEDSDSLIKRKYLNVTLEYITEN